MLDGPTTYDTYWTIFMRDEASLWSTIQIARDFVKRQDLQSRLARLFIVLVMAFVLAFPTLASAMTGYTSKVGAFVQDRDQNLIQFSQYDLLAYTIHDGWRIGLSGDYPITYKLWNNGEFDQADCILNTEVLTSIVAEPMILDYRYYDDGEDCDYKDDSDYCYLQSNVSSCTYFPNFTYNGELIQSEDVATYGFLGLLDEETIWKNKTLSKPSLNISGHYLERWSYGFALAGNNWTNPVTGEEPFDPPTPSYTLANTTYSLEDMMDGGRCQPLSVG